MFPSKRLLKRGALLKKTVLSRLRLFFLPGARILPGSLALRKREIFVILSLIGLSALFVTIPLSVGLLQRGQELRVRAAGTVLGSKLFCQGRKLCPDGRCEGESWYECADCPPGRASLVTEVSCDRYKRTHCYFECVPK